MKATKKPPLPVLLNEGAQLSAIQGYAPLHSLQTRQQYLAHWLSII